MITHAPATVETMCVHRLREAIRALARLRTAHLPALDVAIALDRPLPAARLRMIDEALELADAAIAHGEVLAERGPTDEIAALTAIATSARATIRPRVCALLALHVVDVDRALAAMVG